MTDGLKALAPGERLSRGIPSFQDGASQKEGLI